MINSRSLKQGLLVLFCCVTLQVHAQCLTGWKYYMPLTVTNNTATAYTDIPVQITVNTSSLVTAGKMSSKGDDIRFVDSGSCNTIPYWIESGMNTSNTVIWLKLPKISASAKKTIKMYYGNTSAKAGSNGDSTFTLFDDFDGTSLNTTKWSLVKNGSPTYSVSSGKLNISAPSSPASSCLIVSSSSFGSDIVAEGMYSTVSGYYISIGLLNSGTSTGYLMFYGNYSTPAAMFMGKGSANSGSIASSQYDKTTNPTNLTGLWQFYWPSSNVQKGVWPGGSMSETQTGLTQSSKVQVVSGLIFVSNSASMSIDWMRARKYMTKDPGVTLGTEKFNNAIMISSLGQNAYCAGDSFDISYKLNNTYNAGNVFTAQLSDSSGSFSSFSKIGSVISNSDGKIGVKIPTGLQGSHYRIRIVSSNPADTGDATSDILISPRLIPSFTIDNDKQCLGSNQFNFSNTSTGSNTTYLWNFGDANFSSTANASHTYTKAGDYTVTLYATNQAGCVDSTTQTVHVYKTNPAFSVNTTNQCLSGNAFKFTNKTTGSGSISYAWDFGDGNNSSSTSPSHIYASPGTYTVKLFAISNGCTDSADMTITVYPQPSSDFSVNASGQCFDRQHFVFVNKATISSGSLTYQWAFGDGDSSILKNVSHTYKATGNYTVTLITTSDRGCTDTLRKTISVYPSAPGAVISLTGSSSICEGDFAGLSTNTTGYNYQWLKNGKVISGATHASYNAGTSGDYQAVIITSDGCTDTSKAVSIQVKPRPAIPTITQNGTILSTSAMAKAYQWYKDSTEINGADSNSYNTGNISGTYSIRVTDSNGCSSTSAPYIFKALGIASNMAQAGIQVYPNPAKDILFIDLSHAEGFEALSLIDISGRTVKMLNVHEKKTIISFSLNTLPKGVYLLRLTGEKETLIQKVVLE